MEMNRTEHLDGDELFKKIGDIGLDEARERGAALVKNIESLITSIANLIDDEKEIAVALGISFVGGVSLAGNGVLTAKLGPKRGCDAAFKKIVREMVVDNEE